MRVYLPDPDNRCQVWIVELPSQPNHGYEIIRALPGQCFLEAVYLLFRAVIVYRMPVQKLDAALARRGGHRHTHSWPNRHPDKHNSCVAES